MSPITTHVLDTALGRPGAGVAATLYHGDQIVGRGVTNDDGRIADLLPTGAPPLGEYRLVFDTAGYFKKTGREGFFPRVEIHFEVRPGEPHYHVPLLLSPFGYSTYRGS
ncbi:MAG: hydroxyisourate hydrolase [Planctomycetota bacterium]